MKQILKLFGKLVLASIIVIVALLVVLSSIIIVAPLFESIDTLLWFLLQFGSLNLLIEVGKKIYTLFTSNGVNGTNHKNK